MQSLDVETSVTSCCSVFVVTGLPSALMSNELPSRARVVVIGGGVIGTSIAYHLGHLGWTDTVLLERRSEVN